MPDPSEYRHVVPTGYDAVQKALIEAARPRYDLSDLGQGVDYWIGRPDDVAPPPSIEPVPEPAPRERLPVQVYFGERALHVASGDVFRPVRWVGTAGNVWRGNTPETTASVRRLGTVAVLTETEHVFTARDLEWWMVEAGVPESDFLRMSGAVRAWWGRLRIVSRQLIVSSHAKRGAWRTHANPDLAITISETPLGDEDRRR